MIIKSRLKYQLRVKNKIKRLLSEKLKYRKRFVRCEKKKVMKLQLQEIQLQM